MAKPFLSFEEQINNLENEKGLVIADRAYAERMLREIGYFGLIGAQNAKNLRTKRKKARNPIRPESSPFLHIITKCFAAGWYEDVF